MNTNKVVSTKARKDAEAIKTNLTINWDGMTEEDIRAIAQQALIVKVQGGWRTNGIPTECTLKAVEHKVGTRTVAVKQTLEEQVKSLSATDRAALIAKLQASLAG